MSLRHRFAPRMIATTAALGLAASAMVLGTSTPASAAPITLACNILGSPTATDFVADISTNAPASVPAGTPVSPTITLTMTIPEDLTTTIRSLGTTAIGGTVASTVQVNGKALNTTIVIPTTSVPGAGAMPLSGSGKIPAFTAAPSGTTQTIAVGSQSVSMNLTGGAIPTFGLPCNPKAGTSPVIDSIAVTAPKAASMSVKAKFNKKKKAATVTASLSAVGSTSPGKVAMTLMKGKKKVKTLAASVVGGKAVVKFKKLKKKGKYTVKATYTGSPTAGPTTASTKFKVK